MVEKITALGVPSSTGPGVGGTRNPNLPTHPSSFENALEAQLGHTSPVRFSAHAQRRMESRSVSFGSDEAVRLEQAVEKAARKGSRESLILMDDLAFVVSVQNRVVITAVDAESRKENVFTNIDSVVIT